MGEFTSHRLGLPGSCDTGGDSDIEHAAIADGIEIGEDEEESDDLMRTIKGELSSRRLTDAVRLEVADNCKPDRFIVSFHSCFLRFSFSPDIFRFEQPSNMLV